MDKPNVIYAAAYDPSLERGFLTCSTVPMKHDDVEYIRKDALLNWLKECKENPVITDLQKGNIQEIIEKIESL